MTLKSVTPEAALARQIELCRAMTGEQRLRIALDLHEFACNVARAGIRHQHPDATTFRKARAKKSIAICAGASS